MSKIWTNMIDKKYDVYVERDSSSTHSGTLKVELNGSVIFSTPVSISYGAAFGPDASDVADWSNRACEAVDAYEAKQSVSVEEIKNFSEEVEAVLPIITGEIKPRKVREILNELDVFLLISRAWKYKLVCSLSHYIFPNVINTIFAWGEDQCHYGIMLMDQLELPYVTGDDPKTLINQLLEKETSLKENEFYHRYSNLYSIMSKPIGLVKESIEDGSAAKKIIQSWNKWS